MKRLVWLAALPLAAHMVSLSTGELKVTAVAPLKAVMPNWFKTRSAAIRAMSGRAQPASAEGEPHRCAIRPP